MRIAHRGPDREGLWFAPPAWAGLAHRRHAILDLTGAETPPPVEIKIEGEALDIARRAAGKPASSKSVVDSTIEDVPMGLESARFVHRPSAGVEDVPVMLVDRTHFEVSQAPTGRIVGPRVAWGVARQGSEAQVR